MKATFILPLLLACFISTASPKLTFFIEEGIIQLTPRNFKPLLKYYDNMMYLYCSFTKEEC